MSTIFTKLGKTPLSNNLLFPRAWFHSTVKCSQNLHLPQNIEELAAGEKVGFSSARHRDMINGVIVNQVSSLFGANFMGSQLSLEQSGDDGQQQPIFNEDFSPEILSQIEGYDCVQSVSLHSVMQTNVPEPFTPVNDKKLYSHFTMPGSGFKQQGKYIAGDLKEALHPNDEISDEFLTEKGKGVYSLFSYAWKSNQVSSPVKYFTTVRYNSTDTNVNVSRKEKLKRAVKDYGATVIVFHVTISLASLGICYAAIASGLDIPALLSNLGVGNEMLKSKLASGASTFVVAYAVHKVMAPVRISITLASVPWIVRYLRKVGILKGTTSSSPK